MRAVDEADDVICVRTQVVLVAAQIGEDDGLESVGRARREMKRSIDARGNREGLRGRGMSLM